jgi:hypothetical protein
LISPNIAQQYGLDRAWFTTVQLDPSRGQIAHMRYYVSPTRTHAVFVVNYDDRKRWFSQTDLDRYGEEIGREQAEKLAKEFASDLKVQDIESTVETLEVPEITLFVITDRAMVHAIDAETGRTRWARVIGNRDYPTERPGVSDKYLAVINGTTLYLLKRDSGEIAWSRQVDGVPSAGPIFTMEYIVVPTFSGNVELYDIEEVRTLPKIYKSNGRVLVQPISTPLSIAWPTDRGFLYVARSDKMGLRYRLEAKDTIVCPPAYSAGKMVAASIDGYVYCVHEQSGNEQWRFSTGEPISNTPVPVGDAVYVVTDKGSLFSLGLESGLDNWWAMGIKKFIAAGKERVYCLGELNRLIILDAKTGGRIATMDLGLLDVYYPNLQTDRILLGTKSGVIQCLRERDLQWPMLHVSLEEEEEPTRPEIKQEGLQPADPQPKPDPGQPAGGTNPFGNPFGGGATPPAGNNPFGGGGNTNPFGGGAGGAGAGGGTNPFGGGNTGGGNTGAGTNPFGGGAGDAGAGGGTNPFGGGNTGGGNTGAGANPFGGGNTGNTGGATTNPFGGGGAAGGGAGGAGAGTNPFGGGAAGNNPFN